MDRYNDWHDGTGSFGWVVMILLMIAFWVGLAWVIVNIARHRGAHDTHGQPLSGHAAAPVHTSAPHGGGPEDILHDRLARGDIDVEEYQTRVDALRSKRP